MNDKIERIKSIHSGRDFTHSQRKVSDFAVQSRQIARARKFLGQ